ncbi:beta-ketoacyl synthase N-terminal-like domain-containing protein [Streptomyces sp. NPDC004126]|uniref:beta-ketoacyl synthase N-terminal-like domain-containing protein n=1 Tax=Streptomyces sp. NPDC004126 TaxID=3390695 RepID=UPI003D02446B
MTRADSRTHPMPGDSAEAFVPLAHGGAKKLVTDTSRWGGVGLRLPGAGTWSLDGLWAALVEGRDLVRPVPDGRFDVSRFPAADKHADVGQPGTVAGGFLKGRGLFRDPAALADSDTAVVTGVSSHGYAICSSGGRGR